MLLIGAAGMAHAASPVFSLSLPEASASGDGFDARDAQGRPIHSAVAQAALRSLFIDSLHALLMRPELPRVAALLSLLDADWRISNGVWRRAGAACARIQDAVSSAAGSRTRAPPSAVPFLLSGLALAGLLRFAHAFRFAFFSLVASTVLRC